MSLANLFLPIRTFCSHFTRIAKDFSLIRTKGHCFVRICFSHSHFRVKIIIFVRIADGQFCESNLFPQSRALYCHFTRITKSFSLIRAKGHLFVRICFSHSHFRAKIIIFVRITSGSFCRGNLFPQIRAFCCHFTRITKAFSLIRAKEYCFVRICFGHSHFRAKIIIFVRIEVIFRQGSVILMIAYLAAA